MTPIEIIFIKICLVSAVLGWCYVEKLTESRGLLDFIPKYYPANSVIEKVLRCPHCFSGWLAFIVINGVLVSPYMAIILCVYLAIMTFNKSKLIFGFGILVYYPFFLALMMPISIEIDLATWGYIALSPFFTMALVNIIKS